ncbi:hypothetical protein IIA95_03530, partial [Patescibacteria group bacterium]|nr:hypothetical protein [Patescibacteria group bacterium]
LQLYCGPPHENPGTNGLYLVPIGNSTVRIAALRKGDVDMAVVIVPKHLKALTPGYRLVAILRTPASNFIVRSGYLHDEVARRRITALMAGVQRAVRELSRNPQEAKAFIAKKSKMPNHTDRIYELGMELWSQTGVVPPETVLQWVKFFGEETPEGYQASYDFSAVPSIQK